MKGKYRMELFKKGYKWVLDMDDTLAHFHEQENALERFATENGFFNILRPSKLVLKLQLAILNNEINVKDIYIVSASPNEQADHDKLAWLQRYLQAIPSENILFTRLGQNKADIFFKRHGIKKADMKKFFLVDDYTKNLVEWKTYGGNSIKYINEYNNTKQSYKAHNIQSVTI